MNLLKRITSSKRFSNYCFIYILFIVLHLFLFNVNTAEWGDSYRILRAAEYLKSGTYPTDEKRPPLFSALISLRPDAVDAVFWGRFVVFVFSLASFIVFKNLSENYIKDEKFKILALLLFTFNPVYLYWSIRVMADVPFSFFVLLSFYLLLKWGSLNFYKSVALGILCGLSILTRFEGYLLFAGVLMGVTYFEESNEKLKFSIRGFFSRVYKHLSKIITLGLTTLAILLPWIIYRNPFSSTYFSEPSGRVYDLKMVLIYFMSALFFLGFTSAFYFILKYPSNLSGFFTRNIGIATFIGLEMILILLWPAAIPRLFVPIIPFFIIVLVQSLELHNWHINIYKRLLSFDFLFPIVLFSVFVVGQYFLKLQFLIPVKVLFALLVIVQVMSLSFQYLGQKKYFFATIVFSSVIWSLSVIYIHKNIYTAIRSASEFSRDSLEGTIIYNDTTSVADWYLNYSLKDDKVEGKKWDFLSKNNVRYNKLLEENISYLITTNEDGVSFDKGIEKLDHLKLIASFRYNIGSKEFFANVFEFVK
jgi:4-amino-4-deoxy-L-arabinose transferase-like glycosyltransferase